MAIFTINQPNGGDPVDVQIDKTELKAVSKVSSDPVFSQDSNWNLVTAVFKHDSSNRRLYTVLRDLNQHRLMSLKPQMIGGDKFEISQVLISKADRSHLVVKRSEIPSYANYDFTLKSTGLSTVSLNWTRSGAVAPFGGSDGLQNVGNSGWNQGAYSEAITGDFILQYNVEITQAGGGIGDIMFGYSKTQPSFNGAFPTKTVYVDAGNSLTSYNFLSNALAGFMGTGAQLMITITRVGGLITFNCTHSSSQGPINQTGTIESSYTGEVYPHVLIYYTGARITGAWKSI